MANFRKISISRQNRLFTAISGKIILFLFKSHHCRTYFLYMIRYNNILRPVHDPPTTLLPKIWGVATPQIPRIDAYVSMAGNISSYIILPLCNLLVVSRNYKKEEVVCNCVFNPIFNYQLHSFVRSFIHSFIHSFLRLI